jgi:hypothetical protein
MKTSKVIKSGGSVTAGAGHISNQSAVRKTGQDDTTEEHYPGCARYAMRGNLLQVLEIRANADGLVLPSIIKPTVPGTLEFTYHNLSSRCHKRQTPPPQESVFCKHFPPPFPPFLSRPPRPSTCYAFE